MDNQQIIAELKRQALELENKAKKINEAINVLSELEPAYSITINGTSSKEKEEIWPIIVESETLTSRVAAVIRSAGRFLHKTEIQKIEDFNNLSSVLSSAAMKGKLNITSYRVGASKNNTFWGFKEWLDKAGGILPQYRFREEAVHFKIK